MVEAESIQTPLSSLTLIHQHHSCLLVFQSTHMALLRHSGIGNVLHRMHTAYCLPMRLLATSIQPPSRTLLVTALTCNNRRHHSKSNSSSTCCGGGSGGGICSSNSRRSITRRDPLSLILARSWTSQSSGSSSDSKQIEQCSSSTSTPRSEQPAEQQQRQSNFEQVDQFRHDAQAQEQAWRNRVAMTWDMHSISHEAISMPLVTEGLASDVPRNANQTADPPPSTQHESGASNHQYHDALQQQAAQEAITIQAQVIPIDTQATGAAGVIGVDRGGGGGGGNRPPTYSGRINSILRANTSFLNQTLPLLQFERDGSFTQTECSRSELLRKYVSSNDKCHNSHCCSLLGWHSLLNARV
jgi:hypothetical protein